ncbi:barstar family protein [Deinococcus sp.]|uniref:barstar family protein n=1 Tax=Deinococcus sp. TaxID=47478 RepID=UPI0025D83ACA|nr:barstar family protein [Deinococcus sp.]
MNLFERAPDGIQIAPAGVRERAGHAGVELHEIELTSLHNKHGLMNAFASSLELGEDFGHNWDALYDVLADPEVGHSRRALLLTGLENFTERCPELAEELTSVLLDAQVALAEVHQSLWLLRD